MLRGALLGLGNIAIRGHAPAYFSDGVRSKLQIVAVMDVVEQNRVRGKEHFPEARFYPDLASLLDHEMLDFIDICTPPHTHAEYIKSCAAKGLNLLCEKPLAERFETAFEVTDVIKDAKIVFVPCHQYKYSPLWKFIRDLIISGDLGRISLAQFNVCRLFADAGTSAWKPEWRTTKQYSGGGILVDTGSHYFYLTQYFFGVPKRVSSILRTLKHKDYGVEDTALVTLEYPETLVQINLTWTASHRSNSVLIVGTEGSISYDGKKLLRNDANGVKEISLVDVSDKSQYINWYGSLFNEFYCRIQQKNYASDLLDEALTVMKLLQMGYRAAREGVMLDFE